MNGKKSTVKLVQGTNLKGAYVYRVEAITNRVTPRVGESLGEEAVKGLIRERGTTVTIVKGR